MKQACSLMGTWVFKSDKYQKTSVGVQGKGKCILSKFKFVKKKIKVKYPLTYR